MKKQLTLREKIQKVIDTHQGNSEKAAIAVCELLEDEIGLAGNGWFDNDKKLLEHLGYSN